MAALVVDAAHIRAPFPSPDDDPALRRPAGSRPEELVAPSAENSPVLSDDQQDRHYTRQEPVPSQGMDNTQEATDGRAGCPQQATDDERTAGACGFTNENATATDHVNRTEQCNGESVKDESHLTLRDEYVDRVWDEFVTHFLLGSCHIQKAAIFDLETRRPLAVSGNLEISAAEMEQLMVSLHHTQLAYRNGVTIGGKTYKVRLADGRNGILARTESEGCTVCKTHTLVIIGVHDKRGNSRKCNEDVMRLGDFFRKKAV